MNRRDFVKSACVACAGLFISNVISSCVSTQAIATTSNNGYLEVNKSALTATNGRNILKTDKLPFNILLIKKNEAYWAVYMKCTHYDNPISDAGNKLVCPSHNSEFDNQGKVTTGPATENLRLFPVESKDGIVRIKIA